MLFRSRPRQIRQLLRQQLCTVMRLMPCYCWQSGSSDVLFGAGGCQDTGALSQGRGSPGRPYCPRLPSEHLHSPAGQGFGSSCLSNCHALRRTGASACYCVCPPVVRFVRSQFHWVLRQRSDGPASHAILLYWRIVCL